MGCWLPTLTGPIWCCAWVMVVNKYQARIVDSLQSSPQIIPQSHRHHKPQRHTSTVRVGRRFVWWVLSQYLGSTSFLVGITTMGSWVAVACQHEEYTTSIHCRYACGRGTDDQAPCTPPRRNNRYSHLDRAAPSQHTFAAPACHDGTQVRPPSQHLRLPLHDDDAQAVLCIRGKRCRAARNNHAAHNASVCDTMYLIYRCCYNDKIGKQSKRQWFFLLVQVPFLRPLRMRWGVVVEGRGAQVHNSYTTGPSEVIVYATMAADPDGYSYCTIYSSSAHDDAHHTTHTCHTSEEEYTPSNTSIHMLDSTCLRGHICSHSPPQL